MIYKLLRDKIHSVFHSGFCLHFTGLDLALPVSWNSSTSFLKKHMIYLPGIRSFKTHGFPFFNSTYKAP